jgi:hypothetical protein
MNRSRLLILVSGLAILAASGGVLWRLSSSQKLGRPGVQATPTAGSLLMDIPLPVNVLNYTSVLVPPDLVVTNTLPRDTSLAQRVYSAPDGFQLTMNVVMMGTDRTSIHKPQFCLVAQGWRIEKTESLGVVVPKPHAYELPFTAIVASKEVELNGQRQSVRGVYLYWFVADQALTADHWERMWWMSRDLLAKGTLQRWSYISCFAICYPGQEGQVLERMKQFLPAAVPQFQTAVGPPVSATGQFTKKP